MPTRLHYTSRLDALSRDARSPCQFGARRRRTNPGVDVSRSGWTPATWGVIAACATGLGVPAVASAQGFQANLSNVEGRSQTPRDLSPVNAINARECSKGINVTFMLQGVTPNTTLLEVWTGVGCEDPGARGGNPNVMQCTLVAVAGQEAINTMGQLMAMFPVVVKVVPTSQPAAPATPQPQGTPQPEQPSVMAGAAGLSCRNPDGVGRNDTAKLYFLALKNRMEAAAGQATYDVSFDTSPPSAPSNVSGGKGSTMIRVAWDTVPGATRYRVYWDSNVQADSALRADGGLAGCVSRRLKEGASPHDLPTEVAFEEVEVGTKGETFLEPGLPTGAKAAVAVAAEDPAGNLSLLSAPGCIEAVPTDGFWDAFPDHAKPDQGCSLFVAPGRRSSPRQWLLGLLVVGVVLVARQRGRRQS